VTIFIKYHFTYNGFSQAPCAFNPFNIDQAFLSVLLHFILCMLSCII
jgi:hypothetical protein